MGKNTFVVDARGRRSRIKGSSNDLGHSAHALPDLADCLVFQPEEGRISLSNQRMMMLHLASFGDMRRELIESIGLDKARGLLTRIGFASGARDAELVRKQWPHTDPADAFNAGPRLHALEGIVRVEPVSFEFDTGRGHFRSEFLWHDSSEDEVHLESYGVGVEAACWMQIGYASGYASSFFGQMILYREVECRSMGHEVCRIIGKPAAAWDTASDEIRHFFAETFVHRPDQATVASARNGQRDFEPLLDGRGLIGTSNSFNTACHMLRRVAPTNATVLFQGESGVGKEMFAKMLHAISGRSERPFVAVNCAAIPDSLIEAELFGVEKGAFTGATHTKSGRFERADGGTLFLDEIATLSAVAQGKLLRVLQEGEIERVGGTRTEKVDVRVIAATNVNLRQASADGTFRADLFYRLNVFPILIPPLRDRREDIPLLMSYFLARHCERHNKAVPGFTRRAVDALLEYDFPGNIRELENMVERAVIMAETDEGIDIAQLFSGLEDSRSTSLGRNFDESSKSSRRQMTEAWLVKSNTSDATMKSIKDKAIAEALTESNGNVAAAARLLGMTRRQLAYAVSKSDVGRVGQTISTGKR